MAEIYDGIVDFAIRVNGKHLGIQGPYCVMLPEFVSASDLVLTIEFPGTPKALEALTPFGETCQIEVLAAVQTFSAIERKNEIHQERYVMDAIPIYFAPAKVRSGKAQPSCIRYHVKRYAAYMGENPLWEIDIPGRKCVINGVNYSGKMRHKWHGLQRKSVRLIRA